MTPTLRIVDRMDELIGMTPMLRLAAEAAAPEVEILAKLELLNPGGSIKDRPIREMLDAAAARGELAAGATVIEASSGNTGIALAMLAASRGHPCVVVMPEDMSVERRWLMQAYGARVVLTRKEDGMRGSLARATAIAEEVHAETGIQPFMTRQFDNLDNPAAHEKTTAAEILAATDGRLDALVAGVGTGGTITGCGRILRRALPNLRVIGVEPARAAAFRGEPYKPHAIQGIGAGFVPNIVDHGVIDEVRPVDDDAALAAAAELGRRHGVLVGPSSGANLVVARAIAAELPAGSRVVTFLCDSGERYLA
ncbi:MAG: PLP-dependent cysteine synthase family protein [Deltaproteobacteria bacterium]|nr:PLP-dependent cysteine synthase family protein [Deltaproteobacteria bacterium]